MTYLIIPLSLALVALIGVTVIVWRKMPFLRKLAPDSHTVGDTVMHDFAPEVVDWFRSVPWRRFIHNLLVELEKILRKARLLMSSLDRASDKVIRKVRTVHQATAKQEEQIAQERQEKAAEQAEQLEEPDEIDMDDPEQLLQEEQRLIVLIAQNPKDAAQYVRLARVYMRLQNFSDAIEALAAATKLDPGDESIQKRLERARKLREQQKEREKSENI